MQEIKMREERQGDAEAIAVVNRSAFGGEDEAHVVELRAGAVPGGRGGWTQLRAYFAVPRDADAAARRDGRRARARADGGGAIAIAPRHRLHADPRGHTARERIAVRGDRGGGPSRLLHPFRFYAGGPLRGTMRSAGARGIGHGA